MRLSEIDTPFLAVDLSILKANISKMAHYAQKHGFRLRPHVKTHKIIEIAKMQLEAGAVGITCAKISEAEVMVACGAKDVLIAYPVVGEIKAKRLAQLAKKVKVTVALDHAESANQLSLAAQAAGATIHVLIDIDGGFKRTGLSDSKSVLTVAKQIAALPSLKIEGLFCFPGHIHQTPDAQAHAMGLIHQKFTDAKNLLEKNDFSCPIISCASTPTAFQTHLAPVINEIRPGTYVFNDSNYYSIGAHRIEDCALAVHCTVVSTAVSHQAIIDGGSKTFSSDTSIKSDRPSFGQLLEQPNAHFFKMSEEHGWIDLSQSAFKPKVGDRIRVIPNHACPCINLHDQVWVHENGEIVAEWKVAARGKLQ